MASIFDNSDSSKIFFDQNEDEQQGEIECCSTIKSEIADILVSLEEIKLDIENQLENISNKSKTNTASAKAKDFTNKKVPYYELPKFLKQVS